MSVKKNILFRAGVVYFATFVVAIAIIGKVIHTQIKEGVELKKMIARNNMRDITVEPNRGDILAHDGRLLATSLPTYEIRMDTRAVSEQIFNDSIDALCRSLARLLGGKPAGIFKEEIVAARRNGNRYHLIARRVGYNEKKALQNFPIFRLGRNAGGLIIEEDYTRFQPHDGLAARTIGYITQDPHGNFPGLEGAFDTYLRGEHGVSVMQRLPGGAFIPAPGANSPCHRKYLTRINAKVMFTPKEIMPAKVGDFVSLCA